MKYRKKPVEIDVFRYDGELIDKCGKPYVPDWVMQAFQNGIMYFDSVDNNTQACELFISTLEGPHHASVGDYIVRGVKGELYPVKPDIFEMTYEKVKE